MTNRMFICIALILLIFSNISSSDVLAQDKSGTKNVINITCTADLYNLTNSWASEFCRLNPETKINLIKFTDAKLSNILNVGSDLCFVTNESYAIINNNQLWKMDVGKDVLVPIMNSKNPFLSEIKEQNISPEILAQILTNPGNRKWNVFPKKGKDIAINFYLVNDQLENSMIAKFLSSNQIIDGIKVENNDNMISAIQKDPYSIGFCKLSNLLNSNDLNIYKNITIMPVDKNGNGKIDDFENVYTDMQTFIRKVWIGNFPKELTGNIYSIASQTPVNQTELAFLKWISTNGQQFVHESGYSALASSEKQSNLALLGYKNNVTAAEESTLFSKIGDFFASISAGQFGFALFIVLLFTVIMLMTWTPKNKAIAQIAVKSHGIFDENSIIAPTGLFFDKTHTWAFMEKDGKVRIGIDDFLLHITGSLTKVKMKNPGESVQKGEPIISIMQNGKMLNINSPVSGKIIAQNEFLSTNAAVINQSPYSNGWIYMIEPNNWMREIQFFTMTEKYQEWIKNEFTRLKDFLSVTVNVKMPEQAQVALQDGGIIKDNVLADLGPEVWEEFQINFIDIMK